MEKVPVGRVTHYFGKLSVAVVELTGDLAVGDRISIEGSVEGPVEQTVESMQIEHEDIRKASAGQSIGMKINGKVHEHNLVYKLVGD